jgi:excinuclease UvrABC nuclease subunit
MAAKTFNTDIQGYWRDQNKSGIPNHSGVYFVYVASHSVQTDKVTLHRLIYIGESDNVNSRIQTHEKYDEWRTYLSPGQELCYSTCRIDGEDRFRVEAAYIYEHKPPVNTEYKNSFPFDQTTVVSTGKTALLNTNFTVYRT